MNISCPSQKLCVIILTQNEEKHIERAIRSVLTLADRVLVVDSGSTDDTENIARALGADFKFHPWKNHASQFNWAISQVASEFHWILRLDADEFLTDRLQSEIKGKLQGAVNIDGYLIKRRIHFMQKPVKWGGVGAIHSLRLFRNGKGICEQRWMDEHIVVEGITSRLSSLLIDENLNSLSWWINKHNRYASLEVASIIDKMMHQRDGVRPKGVKRWIKDNFYNALPLGFRAFLYFIYRYFFQLGFLDGSASSFHFLQGFWYRYLVDQKLKEVLDKVEFEGYTLERALLETQGISLKFDPDNI